MTKIKSFDLTLKDGDRLSLIVYKCLASYRQDFFEAVKNGEFIAKLKGYESISKTGIKTVKNFSSDQVIAASQLFYANNILPQKSEPDTKKFVVVPTKNFVPVFDKEGHETGKEEPILEFRMVYGEPDKDWEIETFPLPTALLVTGRSKAGAKAGAEDGAEDGAKAEATKAETKAGAETKAEDAGARIPEQDANQFEECLNACLAEIDKQLRALDFKARESTFRNFENWLKECLTNRVRFFDAKFAN